MGSIYFDSHNGEYSYMLRGFIFVLDLCCCSIVKEFFTDLMPLCVSPEYEEVIKKNSLHS
jgi:hypothetical protein